MAVDNFISRHIGPREADVEKMLGRIGVSSLDELIEKTVPADIRLPEPLQIKQGGMSEYEYLQHIRGIASKNKVFKTFIGMGYYNTISPSVIIRNILENPSWYTSYTPYQAEISQGRLEALLNFQTVVMELTGMEIANASLLDEATAAGEAMVMAANSRSRKAVKAGHNKFFVDTNVFPQTIDVLKTRAVPLEIELVFGDYTQLPEDEKIFGALVQYPAADGKIREYKELADKLHAQEAMLCVAADIMSLTILTPPGEWGADIVFGTTQRFGIPMGYGGPHAAYFATFEKYKRTIPGRIIGVSKDVNGNNALRMALQTREQHIKRERATSNICTAQALLATMAGMYAVYHGAEGLVSIAEGIHNKAVTVSDELVKLGYTLENENFFDTLVVNLPEGVNADKVRTIALEKEVNFHYQNENTVWVSVDETNSLADLNLVLEIFALANGKEVDPIEEVQSEIAFDQKYKRTSEFMQLEVFKKYQSETELMRYIKKLERKDISLTHSMISLGSCTMKLNAASEMFSITWPEMNQLHPFCPTDQAQGYAQLLDELNEDLSKITGFAGMCFQPNSGAAGEYAGLMVIREYQKHNGQGHRNVALIPASAHGTNPASAVQAGMKIVIVKCDENGNIDMDDLKAKAEEHKDDLSVFIVTYPSTHGVFESRIKEMMDITHNAGGQVYMDGANMNAQVGLTSPGFIGADVCHLNLHKTFAIPHGGGGPGQGPIGVAAHLLDFLPKNAFVKTGGEHGIPAVSAAPYGSASVLPISHGYIKMLGGEGLTLSTKTAILNANYMAKSLEGSFDILYTGETGFVGHEMIVECRNFKPYADITEADIAKRLMDYGFHAPTLSFPVHGTLMVEPTESESLAELDRFLDVMKEIRKDIEAIHNGEADKEDNVLRNAPHTQAECLKGDWSHPYSREKACMPMAWVADNKFWPTVSRIDDGYGDRNLMCSCAPIDAYRSEMEK